LKKSRFTEEKIISIIREADAGVKVIDLCRKHGMSDASFYKWKARYGGLDVSQLRRLKDLESENSRLKRMYAELSLTHQALQDAVEKKL
jgi:putative transposase